MPRGGGQVEEGFSVKADGLFDDGGRWGGVGFGLKGVEGLAGSEVRSGSGGVVPFGVGHCFR